MINFLILVKPNAKSDSIGRSPEGQIWVRIAAPAKEGRANLGLILFLSIYLNISKSSITIKSGQASRLKLLEIEVENESYVLSKFNEIHNLT
jgi:uncharacterized protein (TIGR00251 family)